MMDFGWELLRPQGKPSKGGAPSSEFVFFLFCYQSKKETKKYYVEIFTIFFLVLIK